MKRARAAVLVAVLAAAPSARADDRPQLLERAQRARAAGDHAHALEDAQRAGKLHMTASIRRFIAEEELALGRAAEAYDSAQRCTREAALEPPSPNHDSVLLGCRTLLHGVRPQIGILGLQVREPRPAGLAITIAGAPVEDPTREGGYPVAPGAVVVEATALGHRPLRREVVVAPGAEVPVSIALDPIATSLIARDPGAAPPMRSARSPAALVVAAVGVAAIGGGAATWLVATGKYDDLRARCTGGGTCDEPARERAGIESLGTAASIALVAGGVVAAGGLVWYLVDVRSVPALTAGVRLVPGGVRLESTF